jgi:GTP-binding protein
LGDRFLRHIERTRLLLHLVDVSALAGMARPAEAYRIVRGELRQYSETLAAKPELVVATKADVGGWEAGLAELREACGRDVLLISAVTGLGLRELVSMVVDSLEELDAREPAPLGVEEATSPEPGHP